jgi:hypothetical protein
LRSASPTAVDQETGMSKLNELLGSEAGRKALMDAVPLLFLHDEKRRGEAASVEEVPIDRIAWCAGHRVNGLPEDVADNLKTPVELNRVFINGEVLYLTTEGNHRIERFVEAGRKTIPAKVYDWDLAPAVLKKGITSEYMLDKGKPAASMSAPSDDITKEQAETLKALGVVKDETVLAPTPPKKRRIFGFGIGD